MLCRTRGQRTSSRWVAAKRQFIAIDGSPHARYARGRPAEFEYFEIASEWYYNGIHLKQLIERFPDSDLVDDAAYGDWFLLEAAPR